jgi:dUTP pyrophosphatase
MIDPAALPGALSAGEIAALLAASPPLVEGLTSAALQLQPNGLDVCVESIWRPTGALRLGQDIRQAPARSRLDWSESGWLHLPAGAYVARLLETVNLPLDIMALGFPRSTLLRSACGVVNAVWDAGYRGRSEVLLAVWNPAGLQLQRGARILQLVFFRLTSRTQAYSGVYQREHT